MLHLETAHDAGRPLLDGEKLDPDPGNPAPEVLKAVVECNQNNAGIYGSVTYIGRLAVGQTILLRAVTEKEKRG